MVSTHWGIQLDPKQRIATGKRTRQHMGSDEEDIAETRRKYNRVNDCRQDPVEGGSECITVIPSIWFIGERGPLFIKAKAQPDPFFSSVYPF